MVAQQMTALARMPITAAIPTYGRERVLLDTIDHLLALADPPAEILVLDQTPAHEPATTQRLGELDADARIRWLRLPQPSIPAAMNRALLAASHPVVLFLDDDIVAEAGLVSWHAHAHGTHAGVLVAGRVIQPWEEGKVVDHTNGFRFAATEGRWIAEFMGGNFSIPRDLAIRLGGFDENFVRVAYRFEAEFAARYAAAGLRVLFEPRACIHHLKANEGGTRSFGDHLSTWRPDHAVGDYYFGLRCGKFGRILTRPVRAVATRYHMRHPWRIPATLLAEFAGMLWAFALFVRGPRRIDAAGAAP